MVSARLFVSLSGLLCFAPLVQAHPGHQSDGSGLFASVIHSFMSVDHALFLLAIGVGYGLWSVTLRVTRQLGVTRAGAGLWMQQFK